METKTVSTDAGYENTVNNMDSLDKEPRLRWKLSQTMKGIRWSEVTVRGDDMDELAEFTKAAIKKLKEIEEFANG